MPLASCLAAFGLRVGRLEFQSLWYDEGSSIYLARQSLGAITRGAAADIHPPLYYYFLHFWMRLAGSGEYGVRSLSAIEGVLIVALLFALGRRLFGFRAGLVAALLGAASPLLVYFSQEARMYAQVTLFGLLATYLLVRATSGDKQLWPLYGLAVVGCLYSQYIGALALGFQGLYGLLLRRPSFWRVVGWGGAAVAAFVPWVLLAKDSLLGWPSTDAFHAGPELFADAAFRYVFGLSAEEAVGMWAAVGVVVILATATFLIPNAVRNLAGSSSYRQDSSPRRRLGMTSIWLPFLYLAVPLVAMFLLGFRKPVYNPKFALLALPGFLLLVAPAKWLAPVALLAASAYGLDNYYANPAFARDDYRGLARFIQTSQRPGDAVLLDAPGQEQIFPYYYSGGLPIVGLPTDRPLNAGKTNGQLAGLNADYKRLWLVLYGTNGSDPDSYVEKWLASNDFEVENQWFGNVRLAAFAVPSSKAAEPCVTGAVIGSFARLAGCSLTPPSVASGDVWQLGLQWQAVAPAPGDVKVFTHVIDGEGNIWAQRDSDPAGGARPTSTWKPGDSVDDRYGLAVLPGTPPGTYQIEAGMYTPADGKRLPVAGGGDRILLSTGAQVAPASQPASVDELAIPHPLERQVGTIRLIGWGLTLVGQDTERDSFGAGDDLHLTLFWQADAAQSSDTRLTVRLGSTSLLDGELMPEHPTSTWQAGDRYRNQHRLKVAGDARGDLDLTVSAGGGVPVTLTTIHVR